MTDLIPFNNPNSEPAIREALPVDGWVAAWLKALAGRSGSAETLTAYRDGMADFRDKLHQVGLDLDGDPHKIALAAQGWAGSSKVGREVAPATFNQRLAILSSFYEYCIKQELLTLNPIRRIDRRTVHQYAGAMPLGAPTVRDKLKEIDRTTPIGARDYALLSVALKTGRRLSELTGLRWADLSIVGDTFGAQAKQVTLTFRRAKGGKIMADKLTAQTSKALLEYLSMVYGPDWGAIQPDAPVWVSVSNRTRGKALSIQAIADVCQARLGVSKVHTLRHTFAHTMEKAGAEVSEIQARLGHESLQTKGRYLASLRRAENAHADKLDELFGV